MNLTLPRLSVFDPFCGRTPSVLEGRGPYTGCFKVTLMPTSEFATRSPASPVTTRVSQATIQQKLRQELWEAGKQSYCICFTIRCGSTLLCEDLVASGWGTPTEYFQPRRGAPQNSFLGITAQSLPEYLVKMVGHNATPFFGFKIAWEQLSTLDRNLERECGFSIDHDLRRLFDALKFIYIYRENKALQAISAWRAATSNVWHRTNGEASAAPVPYDFEGIKPYFFQVVSEDWLWRQHFQRLGIKPLFLCYESYILDRMAAVHAVGDFLGAPRGLEPQLSNKLAMLRDEHSLELERRFLSDLYHPRHPMWVHSNPPDNLPDR
jgi:LPS sulfotransferase NodH